MPVGDVSSPHPHSVSATDSLSRVAITMSVVYKFGVYSENIHGIFGCIDLIRTLYVSSASFLYQSRDFITHTHRRHVRLWTIINRTCSCGARPHCDV